jgi:acyl-coenzyme A thioesterase PaaI-like protein
LTSEAIASGRRKLERGEPPSETPEVVDRRFAFEPHNCFACGSLNANGLQLDLHVDGERCWTTIELAGRFQGWDGIAHGGIVCTLLDEVMAWSLVDHDNWGLTARLSVDFRRPVPLETPIRAEGWVTRARRRLIMTAGRVIDPATETILATAEATYVAAPEARKRELKERYGFRLVDAAEPRQ